MRWCKTWNVNQSISIQIWFLPVHRLHRLVKEIETRAMRDRPVSNTLVLSSVVDE
jgi:hypothetical protein